MLRDMASTRTALILGAGIMGLSAAWALAREGWAVRVIEQDPIPNPRGASVDHHRLIRHAYGAKAGYMRMVDPAFTAWEAVWRDLGERFYHPTGLLAFGGAGARWLAESRTALDADGRAVEDLDGAGIVARWPMLTGAGIGAAFHMEAGGVLLAERIIAALAVHLNQRGVAIELGRAVSVDAERAALTLEDGTCHEADLLIVAAGPWAPRLVPSLVRRVIPSRQILVLLEPPPRWQEAWENAPMILDLSEDGGFYAVPPVAGTPLKIGDHRFSLTGDAEADSREVAQEEAAPIVALARERLVEADAYRILAARACYYDVEEKERFVVEPLGPRAFVMSGFSGHGFKFGPLLGLALARAAADPQAAAALPGWAAGEAPPPPTLLAALEAA